MTCRAVNLNKSPYDVFIGRGSIWGNPFVIGKDGTRKEVIKKYRVWIETQPDLISKLSHLKDKVLGCYCKPNACHGDVLVEMVNELNTVDLL